MSGWSEIKEALTVIGPIVVILGGVYAILKWRIPMLTNSIKKLEKRVEAVELVSHKQDVNKESLVGFVTKEELYDQSGDSKYMPRAACGLTQETCQKIICGEIKTLGEKLAGIKVDLKIMDDKREQTRVELVGVQKDMVKVTQQLRDFVTQDRQNEIKQLANAIVARINGATKK